MFQTTEITSHEIASDNPVHQRLYFAYHEVQAYLKGNVLEVGCGVGRGLELLVHQSEKFTAIDKNGALLSKLSQVYPQVDFIQQNIPPFVGLKDNTFDTVVSFQVIEHIQNDKLFLQEIKRVLKPGGRAIISTPNLSMSLTRNPWHIREYKIQDLVKLSLSIFSKVETKGVFGNKKVMDYYLENKKSVEKVTRWDIFNMQYWLPASILRIPYDILNRRNRKKLMDGDQTLVGTIDFTDYYLGQATEQCLDFYFILEK